MSMRGFYLRSLILILCLLCQPAFSQEKPIVRFAVAMFRSGTDKVSPMEARDRLVKVLNRRKPDKSWPVSFQAVGLDQSQASSALAEGKEKNCEFVLFTRLTQLETSEKIIPLFNQAGVEHIPVTAAKLDYQVMRVLDGAEYAIGSAKSENASSITDAVLQAISQVVTQVAADLKKGGNVPHRDLVQEHKDAAGTFPGKAEVQWIGPDFCRWLPTDLPHAAALRGICEYAISLPQKMPNFICDQETSRYRGNSPVPRDLITAQVRYEDGNESYTELTLNGRPAPAAIADSPGQWSTGEFGSNLRAIFDFHNLAIFQYSGEKNVRTHAAWVFTYQIVRQNDPLWRLHSEDQVVAPPYGGELWVDQKTGDLLRFRSMTRDIPPTFPTQSADLQTEYDNVAFGDGTAFLLPVSASITTQQAGEVRRNVLQFRNCHKFRARTRMLLDVPVIAGGTPDNECADSAELAKELERNNQIYAILREQAVRDDAARLEAEQWRDLDATRADIYQKLIALEKERRQYMAREAAAASGAPRPSNKEPLTTFKANVDLVLVSVVVRDSRGHAVGNVQKQDFQLFDGGKPQSITSFAIESLNAPADNRKPVLGDNDRASAPLVMPKRPSAGRYTAYVFDDIHSTFEELAHARDAAMRHIAGLRSEDRAAVFTTSGEVELDFTAAREPLQAALKQLQPHPMIPAANCPAVSYYMADLMVNHEDRDVILLAVADAQDCAFHGIERDNPRAAERVASAKAFEVLHAGDVESLRSLRRMHEVIDRTAAMPGERSFVLVSPGLLVLSPGLREDAMDLVDSAVRAGIVIHTLDVRGLFTPGMDVSRSHPSDPVLRQRLDAEEANAQSDVMFELADGTGGTYFHNNNDLNEGFRTTAATPEFVYILGFSPQKLDGKYHKLKVTLKSGEGATSKLKLQARRGYYALKPAQFR